MQNARLISTRRHRRALKGVTIGTLAWVVAWSLSSAAAGATVDTPLDVGDVVIVDGTDQTKVLVRAESDAKFYLRLPEGSTCPGDSANDQWRTQSFIVPVTDDLLDIVYGPIGPEPWDNGKRFALFMADTIPYVHQLLRQNPAAGDPGAILPIPLMDFTVVAGERIPAGKYRIGIACTYFGDTAKYWDSEIVITSPADDDRTGFSWRLANVREGIGQPGQSDQGARRWMILAVAAVGAAATYWFLWQRRSPRFTTFSKDQK